MKPIESLRQLWSPGREVEEVIAQLEPQTELDSQIRDFFSRIVRREGTLTLDLTDPNTGSIRWEVVPHESGRLFANIWWEP